MNFAICLPSLRFSPVTPFFRNIIPVGAFVLFSGCATLPSERQQTTCTHEQELNEVHRQLEALAEDFGIAPEQASRETTLGLISEIRMASRNYKTYWGKALSEEEKDLASVYLSNRQDILDTVLEQDRFIRSLNRKRIILLPDRD